MIKSMSEFFRNLPNKLCRSCGKVLTEQADCYTTECDQCHNHHYYSIHN